MGKEVGGEWEGSGGGKGRGSGLGDGVGGGEMDGVRERDVGRGRLRGRRGEGLGVEGMERMEAV